MYGFRVQGKLNSCVLEILELVDYRVPLLPKHIFIKTRKRGVLYKC